MVEFVAVLPCGNALSSIWRSHRSQAHLECSLHTAFGLLGTSSCAKCIGKVRRRSIIGKMRHQFQACWQNPLTTSPDDGTLSLLWKPPSTRCRFRPHSLPGCMPRGPVAQRWAVSREHARTAAPTQATAPPWWGVFFCPAEIIHLHVIPRKGRQISHAHDQTLQ